MTKYADPNDVVQQDGGYVNPADVVIEAAPTAFNLGQTIRENTPNVLRRPARVLGEMTRVGQLPLMAFDVATGSNTARDYDLFLASALGNPDAADKMVAAMGLGGGAGVMSRGIGPVRGAISGLAGYIGGEAGGKAAESVGINPLWGSIPASLVAGIPMAIPGSNTAAQMARESFKGFTPAQIQAAINTQRMAASRGVPLRPNQAFPEGAESLMRLEQEVLGMPIGKGQLEQRVRDIPEAAQGVARREIRQFGPYDASLLRTNQIRDAIAATVENPRNTAKALSKPEYDAAESRAFDLPVKDRFDIVAQIKQIEDDLRVISRSEAGKAIARVGKSVGQDSAIINPVTGKPFNLATSDTIALSHYLDELDNQIKAGLSAAATPEQKSRMRAFVPVVQSIKQRLYQSNPALQVADEVYGTVMRDMSNKVRATPLAETVSKVEMRPGPLTPAARWGEFKKLIEEGTPDDVSRVATLLRGQDPKAMRDITLKWMDDAFTEAFPKGSKGNPAKFADKLLENQNLDRLLLITALESGVKNPQAVVNGFKSSLYALRMAGTPTAVPGRGADLAQIMQSNPVGIGGRILAGNELSRTNFLVGRIRYYSAKTQYERLYKALNDPDSIAKLEQLGNTSMVSPRFASLLSAIVGGTVAIDQQQR